MRKTCNKNTNKYRQLHFHNRSSQVVYKPILSASASSSAILKPEKALGTRVPSKIASSSFPFLSRIFISHLAFLSRISYFYVAFLSRISHFYVAFLCRISHFYVASRIFISHLAFLCRIFISHLAFLSHISHFYLASRIFISHLAFFISHLPPEFFSFFIKSHLECPLQASVKM